MARWLDAYTLGPRACSLRDGACTLPHRETGLVARCKLSGLSGGLLTVIPASYWPLPHPSNVGADPLLLLWDAAHGQETGLEHITRERALIPN